MPASWGRVQLKGDSFLGMGYCSVENFVSTMCRSEKDHLQALLLYPNEETTCRSTSKGLAAIRLRLQRQVLRFATISGRWQELRPTNWGYL